MKLDKSKEGTNLQASWAESCSTMSESSQNVDDHLAARRLVVVSNRVPQFLHDASRAKDRHHGGQDVSGSVSGLYPALREHAGVWFGWSGCFSRRREGACNTRRVGSMDLVTIDLPEGETSGSYTRFCEQTLWPLFHCFPQHVRLDHDKYAAYRRVNRHFAASLTPLLQKGDLIWIHDYHLIPLGTELQRLGWNGLMGFFLHIPFPPADILNILPWSRYLLKDLSVYNLLGFHIEQYCRNFVHAACEEMGGTFEGRAYKEGKASVRVGAYPLGTDPNAFRRWAERSEAIRFGEETRKLVDGRRIVLGVDRLDYTKGIAERFMTFTNLLERHPSWRNRVSLIQVSAPSRKSGLEYVNLENRLEQLVTTVNTRFGSTDWTPIHFWNRSFTQKELSALYREADVCLVAPLRDGMNLVAKEFVASQAADPGVLVLSRFCGAAEELRDALIINPYDTIGSAETLERALSMPLEERKVRWQALHEVVCTDTAQTWSRQYLTDLVQITSDNKEAGYSAPSIL